MLMASDRLFALHKHENSLSELFLPAKASSVPFQKLGGKGKGKVYRQLGSIQKERNL
jgi:hypothetical protein